MAVKSSAKIGKRGTVVLPARLRRQYGLTEGAAVITEAHANGILIRPATRLVEEYTPSRQAEFLLSNAVDPKDYARACCAVRKLGLDPGRVPHHKPKGA